MLEGLTSPRAAVLEALREQPDPVGIHALARRLGRHHNTVREQVNWLIGHGLVRRYRVPGEGRGRPTWQYQALGPKPAPEDHAEMAADLAWTLGEAERAIGVDDAHARGREWGRERARGRRESDEEARAATMAVLGELGFEPQGDSSDALLTRCPLLQVAHAHPAIVCSLHRGLVEGMLEQHGASDPAVTLVPFGEPGGCPLSLRSR